MNREQIRAAERLRKALQACDSAGLRGGVFDTRFVLWPKDAQPDPRETKDFFITIQEVGCILPNDMDIDGGAGV